MPPVRRGRLRLGSASLCPRAPLCPLGGFLAPAVAPGGSKNGRPPFRPIRRLVWVPEPGPTKILASELPPCPSCQPPRPCSDDCCGVRGCLHCCLRRGGCKYAQAALEALPDPDQLFQCVICFNSTHEPMALVDAATHRKEPYTYCVACSDRLTDASTASPTTRARILQNAVRRFSRDAVSAFLAACMPANDP